MRVVYTSEYTNVPSTTVKSRKNICFIISLCSNSCLLLQSSSSLYAILGNAVSLFTFSLIALHSIQPSLSTIVVCLCVAPRLVNDLCNLWRKVHESILLLYTYFQVFLVLLMLDFKLKNAGIFATKPKFLSPKSLNYKPCQVSYSLEC